MPVPRFRIRTLMIAVAALGLVLALVARSNHFLRQARFHQARSYVGATKTTITLNDGTTKTLYIPTTEGWRHYYMRHRMEQAARRPWWPSDPEPLPRDLPPSAAMGFVE